MSNVLIGIIGVILFIGLALAGALFLGPRFQESMNNSRASAVVQAVSQTAAAASLSSTQSGSPVVADPTSAAALATDGFMKSLPGNPVKGTNAAATPSLVNFIGDDRTVGYSNFYDGKTAKYVMMRIGDNQKSVCDAVSKQSGSTQAAGGLSGDGQMTQVVGCGYSDVSPTVKSYIVWARI